MLRTGYHIPFSSPPPLSPVPISMPSYSLFSVKGKALQEEVLPLLEKGTVELALPSLGYYSRLFVVWKTSGLWRPVIDLSRLNCLVIQTRFKMETNQSVLCAIRKDNWMVSNDLKDAYLQISVHPDARQFLRFVAFGVPYQFKALCFGLSTAPQVFTRAMAPVSAMLHRLGVWMLCYLDDWLVLASSWTNAVWARDMVLSLCRDLGILVNLAKSHLVPARSATYLGMTIGTPTLRAFPSPKRVLALLTQMDEFLSYRHQSVVAWYSLLGRLSSLCLLVPGGRLWMRSLQLVLRSGWDFVNKLVEVEWSPSNQEDLLWCPTSPVFLKEFLLRRITLTFSSGQTSRTRGGVLISTTSLFRASGLRRSAPCPSVFASFTQSVWASSTFVIRWGVRWSGSSWTTPPFSLASRNGWTFSPALNAEAQPLLRWGSGMWSLTRWVIAIRSCDQNGPFPRMLSTPYWSCGRRQWTCSPWHWIIACQFIFHPSKIRCRQHWCFSQQWDGLQAYAFLLFALIRRVLNKLLLQGKPSHLNSPLLATERVVPRAPESGCGSSSAPSTLERSSQTATFPSPAQEPPRASPSCVAIIQRFACNLGLFRRATAQLSLCRRQSSRRLYQHRWECYRSWCTSRGHSVSSPAVAKFAEFFCFLWLDKHLSISAIRGYCYTLTTVFKFHLSERLESYVLRDLIRPFELERPCRPVRPPSWDLVKVLQYLWGPVFEPLPSKPLHIVTMKVAFLVALATGKRVSELRAISTRIAFHGQAHSVSYLPEFVAKMESERNPLPCSILVRSLLDFVGDLLEEHVLCPVRSVWIYLDLTKYLSPCPRSLFVSPRRLLRSISNNTLPFFICRVIVDTGASIVGSSPPWAHSVCGVAALSAFCVTGRSPRCLRRWLGGWIQCLLLFYFRDLTYSLDGCHSLGELRFDSIISHFLSVVSSPLSEQLVCHSAVLCLFPGLALRGTDIRLTMDSVLPSTSVHCLAGTLHDQTGWLWTSLTRPCCSLVTECMFETHGRVIFSSSICTTRVLMATVDVWCLILRDLGRQTLHSLTD